MTGRALEREDFDKEVDPIRRELKALLKEIRSICHRLDQLEQRVGADHPHS